MLSQFRWLFFLFVLMAIDRIEGDRTCGEEIRFDKYNCFESIERYLLNLPKLCKMNHTDNSVRVDVDSLGKTYENRNIYLVKIFSTKGERRKKRSILVEGGIHSTEWLSHAFVLNFINFLITDPDGDPLLQNFEWYIIPVLNPDGYVYTMNTYDRNWRKNRRPIPGSDCKGVDLNRNFNIEWNPENGGSNDPCNQRYAGPSPFSEIESQVERDLMAKVKFYGYLGVHSYGQMWIRPNGWSEMIVPDDSDLETCGQQAAHRASSVYLVPYSSGQITDFFPTISGLAVDYAYNKANIRWAYEVELRNDATYEVPAMEIVPTAKENIAAILKWAECIM